MTREGTVDMAWLGKALKHSIPGLVGVMAANNETGVLQPWREVLALCREHGVPFFCDAAQWVGEAARGGDRSRGFCERMRAQIWRAARSGFSQGTGEISGVDRGGPQEEGRRAGTENVAGVLAMIAALEERETVLSAAFVAERTRWREEFERELVAALPGASILGAGTERLWNTVAAIMPEQADCRQRWVVKLDKLGYAVSTGSACASGKEQTSHVLAAMQVSADEASRALRFSSGWETTREDWLRLLDGLRRAHAELAA